MLDPKTDPVLGAEGEATAAEGHARIAEIGAIAAEEAFAGSERTLEHVPLLAPLALKAAEKSKEAAGMAVNCSKKAAQFAEMVYDERSAARVSGTPYCEVRISRTDLACEKAVEEAQNAENSSKRALAAATKTADLAKNAKGCVKASAANSKNAVHSTARQVPQKAVSPEPSGGRPTGERNRHGPTASSAPKKRGLLDRLTDLLTE